MSEEENNESQQPQPAQPEQAAPEVSEEPHPFDMSERRDFGVILGLIAIVAIIAAAAVVFLRQGGPTGARPSETAFADDIVARVGEREVPMQDFKLWLSSLPQSVHMQLGSPEGRRGILQQYLNRIAMEEYAKKQGVYETDAFKEELENAREMFGVRELVDETFKAQASEDDLREYHKKHKDEFPKPFNDPSQRYRMIEQYRRSIVSRFADVFLDGVTVQKAESFTEPVIAQIIYTESESDSITLEDWETELSALSTEDQRWSRTPQGREELLQRLLRRKALARIAEAREFGKRPDVEAALQEIRPHIAAKVLALDELKDVDPIVDDEILNNRQAYEESRMELAHIMLRLTPEASPAEVSKAEARIKDLYDQIANKGANFEALAREYSEDPNTAEDGGAVGDVGKGELVRPMAEAAFALKKGEVSEPVRTMFGFHVMKALSDPRTEYDEGVARAMARRRIMEGAIETKVGEIVTKMNVAINDPLIDGWDPVSQFLEQQAQAAQAGPMHSGAPQSPAPEAQQ